MTWPALKGTHWWLTPCSSMSQTLQRSISTPPASQESVQAVGGEAEPGAEPETSSPEIEAQPRPARRVSLAVLHTYPQFPPVICEDPPLWPHFLLFS